MPSVPPPPVPPPSPLGPHPPRRSNARKFDGPAKLPLIAALIDPDERGNRARFLPVIFPSIGANVVKASDRFRVMRYAFCTALPFTDCRGWRE
jgi:hypothetical protein